MKSRGQAQAHEGSAAEQGPHIGRGRGGTAVTVTLGPAGAMVLGPHWGGYQWGTECYDELGVWQRALSADEVSQLYNSGSGLAYELF